MSALRLRDVIPPHEVRDQDKLASLIAAYNSGATVTPVVVIDWTDSDRDGAQPEAISGSHRIAALREVYDDETALTEFEEIVTLDGDSLLRALADLAESDSDNASWAGYALEQLGDLADCRDVDFGRLCEALTKAGVLPEEARAALEDQI